MPVLLCENLFNTHNNVPKKFLEDSNQGQDVSSAFSIYSPEVYEDQRSARIEENPPQMPSPVGDSTLIIIIT